MSKPFERNRLKRRYLYFGIGSYALIVLFFCHWGYLVQSAPELSGASLALEAVNHLVFHPFLFFPFDTAYLAYGMLIGLIAPLMIQTEYLRRRDLRPAIENGSAKWNENLNDYQKRYVSMPLVGTGSPNMIFAQQLYLSMDTRKTLRNNNVMVIGGSGTGKSRFFVMPNLLQANCSFVVTDPSGELLETMGAFLEAEGYEIRVFNLVQMEHSDAYNPFSYINKQEDVLVMVDALIKNTTPSGSRSSDPFWEKAETALLTAICFYVLTQGKAIHNFASVMYFLRQAAAEEGETSTLDKVFEAFAKTNPDHIAVTSYAVYKSAGGGKTAQSILISCQTRLQMFNLDAVQALTSTDTLDLGSIGDKKVALFCITPTGNTTFNFLVSMMYTQLFETLYHHAETECPGKRLKYPVRFMLDEFANIGTIPNFCQKLATMRKYEISCSIVLQALSQIKSLYKDEWDVLIANCDSLLFLGCQDSTTLEFISKSLGKETIRTMSSSRSFGRSGGSSVSYNKTGRELMTPDELRTMDNKHCIYFLRGLDPFFARKYDLKSHPNFSRCAAGGGPSYDVAQEKHTPNWRQTDDKSTT